MKIGLVTIAHGHNYGNRLQNYAVQRILEKKGHTVETIRHPYYGFEKRTLISVFLKRILHFKYNRVVRRIWKFTQFNRKYIKFSDYYLESSDYNQEICDKYDLFICGSDQIWNPGYFVEKDSYFLSFVNEKKKIALSASFGVDRIEEEKEKERISKRLKELTAISVREKSAQDIVFELSGRRAELVVDPTMCLSANEWIKIEKKPTGIKNKDKFVLLYLLGKYEKKKIETIIKKFESDKKRVVLLQNEYSDIKIHADLEFAIDPSEFIWLIRNSDMILSDSFHAIVFSLIFHKKFSIVKRDIKEEDISTRIINLIDQFRIKNPYFSDNDKTRNAIVDYETVDDVLRKGKNKFNIFLNNSMGSE